jgi:hypothetical protein
MLSDPDPKKAKRVMDVMLTMKKLEIEPLKKAYEGRPGNAGETSPGRGLRALIAPSC